MNRLCFYVRVTKSRNNFVRYDRLTMFRNGPMRWKSQEKRDRDRSRFWEISLSTFFQGIRYCAVTSTWSHAVPETWPRVDALWPPCSEAAQPPHHSRHFQHRYLKNRHRKFSKCHKTHACVAITDLLLYYQTLRGRLGAAGRGSDPNPSAPGTGGPGAVS